MAGPPVGAAAVSPFGAETSLAPALGVRPGAVLGAASGPPPAALLRVGRLRFSPTMAAAAAGAEPSETVLLPTPEEAGGCAAAAEIPDSGPAAAADGPASGGCDTAPLTGAPLPALPFPSAALPPAAPRAPAAAAAEPPLPPEPFCCDDAPAPLPLPFRPVGSSWSPLPPAAASADARRRSKARSPMRVPLCALRRSCSSMPASRAMPS